MKRIGVADLKAHLSAYLREVESGGQLEVADRHRPIARIVPVNADDHVRPVPARLPFPTIRDRRFQPAGWAMTSTDLLLEDRRGR